MNDDDLGLIKSMLSEKYIKPESVNKDIDGSLYNARIVKCHKVLEEVSKKYNWNPINSKCWKFIKRWKKKNITN